MSATDTPRATPAEFEGRALARPDAELVDQGLAFDLGTMFSRRRMLTFLGIGALGVGAAACGKGSSSSSTTATATSTGGASATTTASSTTTAPTGATAVASLTEIPEETAGPYPGDGSNGPDILEQSGVIRRDIRSSFGDASGVAEGVPLTIELDIVDIAGGNVPFADVAVYVWHCTREGGYSMYSASVADENFLRGVQVADANGKVAFTSIFPACYPGRWPHIHFEVYPDASSITDSTNAIATSQVALPEDACNIVFAEAGYEQSVPNLAQLTLASDNVFGDDSGASQLGTMTGDVASGYVVSLTVGVDTATSAGGAGSMAGGGTPPGGRPAGG